MADPTPDPSPAPAPIKPGYATTEFWLTLLANSIGAMVFTGIIPAVGEPSKIAAAILMVLSTLGYTMSRASLKSTALHDPYEPPAPPNANANSIIP